MTETTEFTTDELCNHLGIERRKLTAWIKQGLPRRKRGSAYVFDEKPVRDWLIEQGLVQAENVVETIAEVGQYFNVSSRTVSYWLARGCPGQPSQQGEPGRFDLDQIAAWREEKGQAVGSPQPASPRSELIDIETETKRLRLQQLRGELVSLDPIRRLFIRHIHESKAVLERIPDEVVAVLPAKTPARVRRQVRGEAFHLIDAACEMLADMCRSAEIIGSAKLTRAERLDLIANALEGLNESAKRATLSEATDRVK